MATTGILFKGKFYAFSDTYPPELEESLKEQGRNRFGQKTTLSTEESDRLSKSKAKEPAADTYRGTRGK